MTKKQTMPNEKKGLAKWTTRDLLVIAVISIIFAAPLTGATYIFTIFIVPMGPLAAHIGFGIWLMPPIFIAYILRRPGAALLAELLIAIISMPFSPFGWMVLITVLSTGVPVELVFLTTRYRNYRLSLLIIAGIIPGLIGMAFGWTIYGIHLLSIEMQIGIVVATIISCAASGLVAKLLADGIAKTGVLSNYAVGQEMQEEL